MQNHVSSLDLPSLKQAKIEIRPSPIHRYGVFAEENLQTKDIIEESPIITITKNTKDLCNYVFYWDEQQSALAFGCGSMFNHSDMPNACYYADKKRGVMVFTASRPIQKDEEILIDYGKNWFSTRQQVLITQQKQLIKKRIRRLALTAISLLFLVLGATILNSHFKPAPSISPFRFVRVSTDAFQTQYSNHSENSSMAQRK